MYCPICKKKFTARAQLSGHLTKIHKLENNLEKEQMIVYEIFGESEVEKIVNDYIQEKYCIYDLPIDIAKYLSLLGVKRTSKQERMTDRYKQKYLNGIQQKYGTEITNISQVKKIQSKKEKTYSDKYGSYENYLLNCRNNMQIGFNNYVKTDKFNKTYQKIKNTCLEKYGHENFGLGEAAKCKSIKTKKETIAQWDYEERLSRTSKAREAVNSRGGYSSKPEKRVRKALIDLDIEAAYNKHLFNYNWDLIIDKFIIEVQGIMWHAKPTKYKESDLIMGKILAKDIWEKDKKKQTKARTEGYIVIEIWEDEISSRNDIELCELVKNRLIENGYEY
jgi:G:T-mismatch repair DNA endonuclease (very short patch repair protein)